MIYELKKVSFNELLKDINDESVVDIVVANGVYVIKRKNGSTILRSVEDGTIEKS